MFRFDVNLTTVPPWSKSNWSHTDLYRLKAGKVSAQVTGTDILRYLYNKIKQKLYLDIVIRLLLLTVCLYLVLGRIRSL